MRIDNSLPSMNIGLYSKNIIMQNKDKLLSISLNSNDSAKLMNLKNTLVGYEDFILHQGNYNNGDKSEIIQKQFTSINGKISNGLLRIFNRIDFIKYQSNAYSIQSIGICKI
jgi:hypothetical protein